MIFDELLHLNFFKSKNWHVDMVKYIFATSTFLESVILLLLIL
jgi:hypothetical protein